MSSHNAFTILLVSLILFVGTLAACTSTPPRTPNATVLGKIRVEPTAVDIGEEANIVIDASGDDLQFKWTVTGGTLLSSETASSVQYKAPDSPGTVIVTVEVTGKGGTQVESITLQIVQPTTPPTAVTVAPTISPTFAPSTPSLTPSPTVEPCVCQFATDTESLSCLIHSESRAANEANMALIRGIFAPDAIAAFGNTIPMTEWPFETRYTNAFSRTIFTNAIHYAVMITTTSSQKAIATSGSRGDSTPKNGGTTTHYENPPPSDHWIFEKNDQGCWLITRFEFGADKIPFPRTPQAPEATPTQKP